MFDDIIAIQKPNFYRIYMTEMRFIANEELKNALVKVIKNIHTEPVTDDKTSQSN